MSNRLKAPPRGAPSFADRSETGDRADWTELRQHVDQRLIAMDTYRYSWWTHWREIADYILPRRYRWLITPNQWNRGSPINQRIIDNTATIALRNLASGMMSGVTSPARPWMRLDVADPAIREDDDARLWLADTSSRMLAVMAQSNYYTAKAMQYVDLGCFGTAPMMIYEDIGGNDPKIINCYNPCAGEYYCSVGPKFTVDTFARKYVLTIDQMVREFGYNNCSSDVQSAWIQGGANLEREIIIAHMVEPNPDFVQGGGPTTTRGVPNHFAYQEVYWQWGNTQTDVLRVKGFYDQPFSCPRWDVTGNDPYGRSPAMDALGDTKQLQVQQKRKMQGIDKMVNPPMTAGIEMKNQPASLIPGDVTYVTGGPNAVGFKPVFEARIPVEEIMKDITQAQGRIKDTFYNDLFLMISQLDTVRTATEIDARREEKLMMLGPVLERFNTESLSADVIRIYRIMMRNGLFAPVPAILRNSVVQPVYISSLADLQRASITTSIERCVAFVGSVAGADASAVDKIDFDAAIDLYAEALRVPPKMIRVGRRLDAVRQARAQHDQQTAAMQATQAGVQGAQVLSNTDVGGGQNALQMILQGLPGGGGGAPPAGGAR